MGAMPRPNWFLAWPIDGSFLNELPAPSGFRKLHPEDAHITLAFLGGCKEAAAHRSFALLSALLDRDTTRRFEVVLDSVVPMGPKRRFSALSALLGEGRMDAEGFIGRWRDELCAAAEVRADRRPPKAHATVARPRFRATEEQRAAGLLWAASLDLRHVRQSIDRVALYTWHEPRGIRQFRIVAERPLGAGVTE
jgi:2'-5' RNA ligase